MDLADMLNEINQLQRSCVVCDFTAMRHSSKAEMKVEFPLAAVMEILCLIYKTKGVLVVVMTVAHIVSSATVCFIWLR